VLADVGSSQALGDAVPAAEADAPPRRAVVPPLPAPLPSAAPPARGTLVVRSTPTGARVFVDGQDRGATPLRLAALSLGAHAIRITRDGYAQEDRRLSLTATRPSQTLTVSLVPASASAANSPPAPSGTSAQPTTGLLRIESRPLGASVYVNDRLVGKTPLQIGDVTSGEHSVRLELDGYGKWITSVRVTGGVEQRVAASLEQLAGRD
jgi:hypothetical protein